MRQHQTAQVNSRSLKGASLQDEVIDPNKRSDSRVDYFLFILEIIDTIKPANAIISMSAWKVVIGITPFQTGIMLTTLEITELFTYLQLYNNYERMVYTTLNLIIRDSFSHQLELLSVIKTSNMFCLHNINIQYQLVFLQQLQRFFKFSISPVLPKLFVLDHTISSIP